MSMHQVSKPRAANQSITEESGRPGTVRSKVGCAAIEEPCTKRMVPFGACAGGRRFLPQEELDVALPRPVLDTADACSGVHESPVRGGTTYCTHFLCKNPPRLRRGGPMPIGTLDTFPKLLMHHAARARRRPAIREKDLGIWQTWTWQRFADEVRALAVRPARAGLRRGEHVALVGDNRPRLYCGDVRRPVPRRRSRCRSTRTRSPRRWRSRSRTPRSRFAFAEDQEQVDKLLEILPQLPDARSASSTTTRAACATTRRPSSRSYESCSRRGREIDCAATRLPRRARSPRAAAATPPACSSPPAPPATPKGVVLTHASLHRPRRAPRPRWSAWATTTWSSPTCRRRGSARTSSPTRSRSSPATASAARSRPRP